LFAVYGQILASPIHCRYRIHLFTTKKYSFTIEEKAHTMSAVFS